LLLCVLSPLLQDGVQPLHICAEKGHREVAAVLITAGAAPNTKDAVSSCRLDNM
jgi:ankyrin repeat protein